MDNGAAVSGRDPRPFHPLSAAHPSFPSVPGPPCFPKADSSLSPRSFRNSRNRTDLPGRETAASLEEPLNYSDAWWPFHSLVVSDSLCGHQVKPGKLPNFYGITGCHCGDYTDGVPRATTCQFCDGQQDTDASLEGAERQFRLVTFLSWGAVRSWGGELEQLLVSANGQNRVQWARVLPIPLPGGVI